jgi:SNF2-related domain/Helicase conserved C-terminal domain
MAWAAIEPDTGMLAVGCASTEDGLAIQVPGMNYARGDRIWRAPLSWPAYVALRTIWSSQPLAESAELQKWAANAWSNVQISYGLRSAMDATGQVADELAEIEGRLDPRIVEIGEHMGAHQDLADAAAEASPLQLYPYQRGGVQWLVTEKRAILNDPLGNGKTVQTIRAIQVLRKRRVDGPVLIVCTGAMIYSWLDEFAAWAPELSVRAVTGTALRRRQALEDPADVYVIGWPNVRTHTRLAPYPSQRYVRCAEHGGVDDISAGRCEVHPKELNAIDWAVIVADAAHKMQDAKSKQTRAVWWLAKDAEYFWPLTGTLVADSIENVWPIEHGIDARAWPSKSRYLDLYAVKNFAWHGGSEILGIRPDTAAAFHTVVQPTLRRIPKEAARPDQPARLPDVFRYPEMEARQARAYAQLRKELLADLAPGQRAVPDNAAVRFGRMCQLAASWLDVADGEDAAGFTTQVFEPALPSPKIDDLIDFLEGEPGQLVVAANSPRLVELAARKLDHHKITHCRIVGGMSPEDKHNSVRWFQDGQCRVIFITNAGGEGITLTAADTIFFLQPDPSFLSREEKIGRVDRTGQRNAVRVVYSITHGTVEKHLYELGCEKAERAHQVTDDPALLRWILDPGEPEPELAEALPGT